MTKPRHKLTRLQPRLGGVPDRLKSVTIRYRQRRIRGRRGVEIRARFLELNPFCVECEAAGRMRFATIVDHVIPLAMGGADTDDNKQALCDACNRIKTSADRRAMALGGMGS